VPEIVPPAALVATADWAKPLLGSERNTAISSNAAATKVTAIKLFFRIFIELLDSL
jgi:hypothetical protein